MGGYRDDPEWAAAAALYVADMAEDETPDEALARRVSAAETMRRIERAAR